MESNVKNKKQQAMPKSEAESFGIKRNPAIRAPRIYLSEEEIIRIMRKEAAIKKKIGNLIDSMFCDDSHTPAMDNTEKQTEAFDINEFVSLFLFVVIFFRRHIDAISVCLFQKSNCHKSGNGIFSCVVSIMFFNSMIS